MRKWKFWLPAGSLLLAAMLISPGCTTLEGAGAGAVMGAIPGAIIGHQKGRAGEGAAIGAGLGALMGALYGSAQERKAAETRVAAAEARAAQAGVSVVQRVVQVSSADGQSFSRVVLQQEPEGWLVISPATGQIFHTMPTPQALRQNGYGPGGAPR